jgi:hypothetical protein
VGGGKSTESCHSESDNQAEIAGVRPIQVETELAKFAEGQLPFGVSTASPAFSQPRKI